MTPYTGRSRSVPALLATVTIALLAGGGWLPAAEPPARPNIIFILLDDMGYGDPSCFGQQTLKTPNLDALAAAIDEQTAVVPGIDGQKMSKSYDNTIPIFMEGKGLKKQVMAIQTDATPVEEPKNPDTCNLYKIFTLFASPERLAEVRDLYVNGGAAYGYLKLELLDLITDRFAEARARKNEFLADPGEVRNIMRRGADKARQKALPTLELVRDRVGLNY